MLAKFYLRPVSKTVDDTGLPLYKDEVFVIIKRDSTHTVERLAEPADFTRFHLEYAHFLKSIEKMDESDGGVPLELWPVATPADVLNLKARGIKTVQQLAKVNSKVLSIMPGPVKVLVDQAKRYMEIAGAANALTKKADDLAAEIEDLTEQVRSLKAQNAKLVAKLEKEAA